jgi:5-methylthioadenosine/S-adenosylhomocysteine deaminase
LNAAFPGGNDERDLMALVLVAPVVFAVTLLATYIPGAPRVAHQSDGGAPLRMIAPLRSCLCLVAAFVAASANAQDLELKVTVVTPSAVVESAVVTVAGGRIASVTPGTDSAKAVAIDGVMFPGLIDLHNHLTWNVLPNWQPPRLFSNRYDWQELPEYAQSLSGPYNTMMNAGAGCDMNRFGEVKSIVNGGTSTVGGFGPTAAEPARNRCIQGLARNLDLSADLTASPALNQEPYRNVVFPFEISPAEEQTIRTVDPDSTDPTRAHAAVMHLAEGTDAAARREFRLFRAHQYLRKGVSVIHGVALAPDQIRELAAGGVGFVWSPHGNFILYGQTADVMTAIGAGMTVAIGPDWSPTGSAGMLEELGFAYRYSLGTLGGAIPEATLVQMATSNPARLAKIDGQLGSLEPGKIADLLVMKRRGRTAYQSLLTGSPADVLLVTVGGVPVYGDRALMRTLLPNAVLEEIIVCGEPKALHIVDDGRSDQSWERVHGRLKEVMKPLGLQPAPLVACGP